MSFVLLHADRLRSVVAADALVPASEVETVRHAAELLAEACRLRDAAVEEVAQARAAAHAEGLAAGQAQGRAEADAQVAAALVELQARAVEQEVRRRGDIARLAIEVVRRVAGEVGEASFVAGLAERAAAALAPDQPAVVRVAPGVADAVRARLSSHPAVTVEADPAVTQVDCVLETTLGRTHAGLETQLGAIERAWAAA